MVKRILLIPVKMFLYAFKHDMYGILFWYALAIGAVYAAIFTASPIKGIVGFGIVGAACLTVRLFLRKCTWIIGRRNLLERKLRHREKLEGLKAYLLR